MTADDLTTQAEEVLAEWDATAATYQDGVGWAAPVADAPRAVLARLRKAEEERDEAREQAAAALAKIAQALAFIGGGDLYERCACGEVSRILSASDSSALDRVRAETLRDFGDKIAGGSDRQTKHTVQLTARAEAARGEHLTHQSRERERVMTEPPVHKYKYTLVIRGNSHAEIQDELLSQTRGGYLLDSDYESRDTFDTFGGRDHATLEHTNPEMTPERYAEELSAWSEARKAARSGSTVPSPDYLNGD